MVDSDAAELETLARGLSRHGHDVRGAATGAAALESFEDSDIVLLDLDLPDLDGIEVCRDIRLRCEIPVIAVTYRGSELDRVLGLQAGADDYLVKPYGFRELLARMDAVTRRADRAQAVAQEAAQEAARDAPQSVSHGALEMCVHTRRVTVAGRPIDLTRLEFDLLHLLASHPGEVMPRRRIMLEIWGDTWSRRTLDTHVGTLRKKLGARDWVLTTRGVGFQLGPGSPDHDRVEMDRAIAIGSARTPISTRS